MTFFYRMWETDTKVADILNEHHKELQRKVNEKRHPCTKYDIGDWVWVKRPPAVGGVGLKSLWHGAYRIVAQNGEDSYQVKNADSTLTGVHATQLAKCTWEPLGELPRKHQKLRIPPDSQSDQEEGSAEEDEVGDEGREVDDAEQ